MEEQNQNYSGQSLSSNSAAYTTAGVIQLRLNADPIVARIEAFLRAAKEVVEPDEKGNLVQKFVQVGKPKCNDEGVQSILIFVSSLLNSQTVQGNFSEVRYSDYIYEINISLATIIVANKYGWDIEDKELDLIIDFIMLLLIPFFSRTIDNKERESYSETMKHIESNTMRDQNRGFSFFSKGGK